MKVYDDIVFCFIGVNMTTIRQQVNVIVNDKFRIRNL